MVDLGCFTGGNTPEFADPELGRCRSFSKLQKSQSEAEHAIEALRCINKAAATADQMKSGPKVKARFHKLANAENFLPRSNFPECIGAQSMIYLLSMASASFLLQMPDKCRAMNPDLVCIDGLGFRD